MAVRSTYPIVVLLAALAAFAVPAGAEEQTAWPYRTRQGDTMASIAVKYYSTPDAAQALYDHNESAFDAAYEANRKANQNFDPRQHPKGKNSIFEGTDIILPVILESKRGTIYPRRFAAMDDSDASALAKKKNIQLVDVMTPLRSEKPKWIQRRTSPPSPPQGQRQDLTKGAAPAKREPQPPWFTAPKTEWQRCAKAVCDKYVSLCYYECLFVAKRFTDADAACTNLPAKLPYQLNTEGRDDCAAALK